METGKQGLKGAPLKSSGLILDSLKYDVSCNKFLKLINVSPLFAHPHHNYFKHTAIKAMTNI